jgi:hypothetical protein
MNDPITPQTSITDLEKKIADLTLALKVSIFALLLGASYFDIRVTYYIKGFNVIFQDMLNGASLPAETALIVSMRDFLLGLSCALPIIGLVALFTKSLRRSMITISICLLAAIVQYSLTWWAMFSPFREIVSKMAGP